MFTCARKIGINDLLSGLLMVVYFVSFWVMRPTDVFCGNCAVMSSRHGVFVAVCIASPIVAFAALWGKWRKEIAWPGIVLALGALVICCGTAVWWRAELSLGHCGTPWLGPYEIVLCYCAHLWWMFAAISMIRSRPLFGPERSWWPLMGFVLGMFNFFKMYCWMLLDCVEWQARESIGRLLGL